MALKAVLIGDTRVGKTAVFTRLETDTFVADHAPTIGGAFTELSLPRDDGSECKLCLWDTAGQERFRNVVPLYFQDAKIILLVYDITSRESFQNINSWVDLARTRADPNAHIILIGNKSDLINERVIDLEELQRCRETIGAAAALEVSAKTADGFDFLTQELVSHVTEPPVVRTLPMDAVEPQSSCAC